METFPNSYVVLFVRRSLMLSRSRVLIAFIGLSCSDVGAQDEVMIHVWNQCSGNVGHVALSTEKSYISLWPEEAIAPKQGVFDSGAIAHPDYEADCEAEGKAADRNYVLLLDTSPIDAFWSSLSAGSSDLGDGKLKLPASVRWFGPSGTNIPPSVKGAINLNCASTVVLALQSCEMEGIDRLVKQLSQPTTATSLDVRGSIATALEEGKDQAQRLMEFSN